jgi:predicted RNase H-like HicB family nuclease
VIEAGQRKLAESRRERPVAANRISTIGPERKTERQRYPMKYRVALHRSEEGYCVWVPGLPGCVSQGETEEEALVNIAEGIREYLEVVEDQLADAEIREVEVAV